MSREGCILYVQLLARRAHLRIQRNRWAEPGGAGSRRRRRGCRPLFSGRMCFILQSTGSMPGCRSGTGDPAAAAATAAARRDRPSALSIALHFSGNERASCLKRTVGSATTVERRPMSDLLNCELVPVDGRLYRALYAPGGRRAHSQRHQQHNAAAEPAAGDRWDGGEEEDEEEASVPISQEGDAFVARLFLDSELFPMLIGQQGRTRKQVEQQTGASISFPSKDTQAGPAASSEVTVKGPSRGAVARACTQIELLVSQQLAGRGPRSLDYNFFLSLPLASPDTIARLEAFRDAVLAEPGAAAAGLEPSLFVRPQHLHLTIAMLKLYSDERRELARQTLRSLAPAAAELLGGGPLEVQLKGLEYMNDDPSQMHVMYLGVRDAPGGPGGLQRLQRLCDAAVEAFGQAGLLLPQDERAVKLHATVINTRLRRRPASGGSGVGGGSAGGGTAGGRPGQQHEQRQAFDGRALLERHADMDLGAVRLPAVHLSRRGEYDSQTGFYACAAALPLP